VANLVLSYRFGGGFGAGTRLHFRTGKLESTTIDVYPTQSLQPFGEPVEEVEYRSIRVEQRMPPFFRADAQVSYSWTPDWGRMRITLEWLNVTMAEEPLGLDCNVDDFDTTMRPVCKPNYGPAIFVPNLAMRAEF
jgi:hypothetical protein